MILSKVLNHNDGMIHTSLIRVGCMFKEDGRTSKFFTNKTYAIGIATEGKYTYFDFHTPEYRDKIFEELQTRPVLGTHNLREPIHADHISEGVLKLIVPNKDEVGKFILLKAGKNAKRQMKDLDLFRYHKNKIFLNFRMLMVFAINPQVFLQDCANTLYTPRHVLERGITPLQFFKYLTNE
jgi:hypothetical protein